MIDHIGITVSDYAAAKAFYTEALGAIGAKMMMEFISCGTNGQDCSGWGRDQPTFWLSTDPAGTKPTPVHVAFSCADRASVDKFYAAAIAAGATCNGKPGLRAHYHPAYYGAFIKDRDGHNIEAVCHLPE
jgi:catechol 2,3-dioxygenase-like lactoylglutathione lyase family enzyme